MSEGQPRATAPAARCQRAAHSDCAWALAVEPGGRIGADGLDCLDNLARDAANLAGTIPGPGRPGRFSDTALRFELDAVVAKCDAQRALTAQGAHQLASLG